MNEELFRVEYLNINPIRPGGGGGGAHHATDAMQCKPNSKIVFTGKSMVLKVLVLVSKSH